MELGKGSSLTVSKANVLGIYIHIPFCKQACYYCDFHFSTLLGKKEPMVQALCKELELRKQEGDNALVETIYFGGGTPSLLEMEELDRILDTVHKNFNVASAPEITVEANPDDLTQDKIKKLSKSPVNRLSIGIQSFFEEDLQMMNRAHTAKMAKESLARSTQYFNNVSIDLIYGMPNMDNARWEENIAMALSYNIPHISSYALTVEPRTALYKFVKEGKVQLPDDAAVQAHHQLLVDRLESEGYVGYEVSNFAKPGFYSRNNSAYWQQKKYMGIGPSAHSFDGSRRSWNSSNNSKYVKSIGGNQLPNEMETLTMGDSYNEYIMTGLRTIWGVSLPKIAMDYGDEYLEYLVGRSKKYVDNQLLQYKDDVLLTTKKGRFLTDGIAADLFMVNL